ncbi:MAG TPA: hypothetical protein VK518_23870 [Puia sp.]|nr:hypothetical protein [Puia sp.]
MNQEVPLKRFEYSITDPALYRFRNVDVDFEKKCLRLVGEGLKVNATIYSGSGVELSDELSDGLVFSLEGILEDGKTINTCSGLLVLHHAIVRKGQSGKAWHLSVYLYDDHDDEREIRFNLAMQPMSENAPLN